MMATILEKIYFADLDDTPLGDLRLVASDLGLVAVEWARSLPQLDAYLARLKRPVERNPAVLKPYLQEVLAYTKGKLRRFGFQIDWETLRPFQKKAMQAVYAIPYGETRTYAEIAGQIGHPNASRAVGRANATNPMPLVIPCHRLIGTDGKLHGYGGGQGLQTKEWLLKMEGAILS